MRTRGLVVALTAAAALAVPAGASAQGCVTLIECTAEEAGQRVAATKATVDAAVAQAKATVDAKVAEAKATVNAKVEEAKAIATARVTQRRIVCEVQGRSDAVRSIGNAICQQVDADGTVYESFGARYDAPPMVWRETCAADLNGTGTLTTFNGTVYSFTQSVPIKLAFQNHFHGLWTGGGEDGYVHSRLAMLPLDTDLNYRGCAVGANAVAFFNGAIALHEWYLGD